MDALALIIPSHEQERWRTDSSYCPLGQASMLPEHDLSRLRRFSELQQFDSFEPMLRLVSTYVHRCVLYPRDTAPEYWSCTCLTGPNSLIRVNIADQEVFAILKRVPGEVRWTLNEDVWPQIDQIVLRNQAQVSVERWGKQRISILVRRLEIAMQMMAEPEFCTLIRECNLGLMKRKNIYQRYHNYLLAQAIVGEVEKSNQA